MSQAWSQLPSQMLSLQAQAAGLALGCAYSGSDEYEAAIIAERRSAGMYNHGSHQLAIVVGLSVVIILLLTVV